MNIIKRLYVNGFKIFQKFEIDFNPVMNIIIGENESGKSTILEAIDIVLNKKYANFDKYIIRELLNRANIDKFEKSKKLSDLPKIEIFILFELDNTCDINFNYKGEVNINGKKVEDYGIKFTCELNMELAPELSEIIAAGKIPYEYYEMSWTTFEGSQYNNLKKPLKYLAIDNSKVDATNTFNYYNRSLFNNKFNNPSEKMKICNDFRTSVNELLNDIDRLDDTRYFGIDNKKVILENIISVFEEDIQLENKGKGRENLVKTEIALDKNKKNIEVVSIEEPENHLSHINLRMMLEKIKETVSSDNEDNSPQIIVTTHNSLIVNTLNISNVILMDSDKAIPLKKLSNTKEGKKASEFFEKADNLNLLQFLLSKKVILMEGPTEYMIMQYAYPKIHEKLNEKEDKRGNLESEKVEIISCGGIGYKNYIEIAKHMNKKVAIITDNDNLTNTQKYDDIKTFNSNNTNIQIFTDEDKSNWTWEVSLYNLNKDILDNNIKLEDTAEYLFNKIKYEPCLGKMLNNKVDTAYLIVKNKLDLKYPKYFEDCVEWIEK